MFTSVKLVYLGNIDYFCKNNRYIMNKRLEQFLKAENISQSQFADNIGVARGSVSHILSGRNRPGFDFLLNMAKAYPSLNLDWLITGKGKMYGTGKGPSTLFEEEDDNLWGRKTPHNDITAAVTASTQLPSIETQRPQNVELSKASTLAASTKDNENKRGISRIIVFFDDNTFQEFRNP